MRLQDDEELVQDSILLRGSDGASEDNRPYSTAQDETGEAKPEPKVAHLIHANLLIPGKGPPTIDNNVVIEEGKIVFVGPSRSLPAKWHVLLPTYVPVLLPGYVGPLSLVIAIVVIC